MLGDEMIWVGEELTVGNLLNRYSYLKENYGLNALKLGFSIGISESSISRIFNKRNKAQRSTLIALDVALSEWDICLRAMMIDTAHKIMMNVIQL